MQRRSSSLANLHHLEQQNTAAGKCDCSSLLAEQIVVGCRGIVFGGDWLARRCG